MLLIIIIIKNDINSNTIQDSAKIKVIKEENLEKYNLIINSNQLQQESDIKNILKQYQNMLLKDGFILLEVPINKNNSTLFGLDENLGKWVSKDDIIKQSEELDLIPIIWFTNQHNLIILLRNKVIYDKSNIINGWENIKENSIMSVE